MKIERCVNILQSVWNFMYSNKKMNKMYENEANVLNFQFEKVKDLNL